MHQHIPKQQCNEGMCWIPPLACHVVSNIKQDVTTSRSKPCSGGFAVPPGPRASNHRSSCRTSCKAGSPATAATVSRKSSNSELARACCAAAAMTPLRRETPAARKASALVARACVRSRKKAVGSGQRKNHKAAARRARQHGGG